MDDFHIGTILFIDIFLKIILVLVCREIQHICYKDIDNIVILGINITTAKYSDGTDYNSDSYNFEGDNIKFLDKLCVYAKRGIGFKPRGSDCTDYMNYYCLWNRKYTFLSLFITFFKIQTKLGIFLAPECPTDYILANHEEDGRTCYGLSAGI